ncbi:hypothetical protein [Streptomyces scopuliridis]|uniref:hypothetical protein n=1 Tax=Streptomyces scopuliridis TaxID=452529 RepID=UPI0035DAA00B
MTDTPQSWPCAVCDKPSKTRVHDGCREHIKANLLALPGLYRALEEELTPGRRGNSGGRPGTHGAPIPVSLEVLDLRARGGIEGVLGGWARDVCDRENWTVPALGTIEAIIKWGAGLLLANLPMICDEHPAIREIADELRQITGQARRLITGEKPPRHIPVACPCGQVLRITLNTAGERCPGCAAQYGHTEVLRLPMAERRVAA